MTYHSNSQNTDDMSATLRGGLASIVADPDCCEVSKAIARGALTAAKQTDAIGTELTELRAFRDRVMAAVQFDPGPDSALRDRVAADLQAGMSLRKCASKHGVTFGVVRGIATAIRKGAAA